MCHSWVKRLIRWDSNKQFKFAPLDGDAAKEFLTALMPDYLNEDTIIYYDEGNVFVRSEAALRILSQLEFPISILRIGLLVPKPIRDAVYKKVAANRFKFGDRYESCPLPPAEWRDRFLI